MNESKSHQDVAERLLHLAVHAAPSGILVVDDAGRIVFANAALVKMFGYAEKELIGQAIEALVPETVREIYRQSGQEAS